MLKKNVATGKQCRCCRPDFFLSYSSLPCRNRSEWARDGRGVAMMDWLSSFCSCETAANTHTHTYRSQNRRMSVWRKKEGNINLSHVYAPFTQQLFCIGSLSPVYPHYTHTHIAVCLNPIFSSSFFNLTHDYFVTVHSLCFVMKQLVYLVRVHVSK